jgi:Flp pilus assembly protein TadD
MKRVQVKPKPRKHALTLVAVAFGGGFLASVLLTVILRASTGPRSSRRPEAAKLELPATGPGPSVDAFISRALSHLSSERYGDAFKELERGISVNPRDPRLHHLLGDTYAKLDRAQLAEQNYRKALEVSPEYQPAKVKLAQILCDLGKNEESVKQWKEIEAEDPGNPVLLLGLARDYLRLARPADAIAALEKYNQVKPRQVFGYAYLGRAHAEAGRAAEAEQAYRQAISIQPKEAMPHLWLGQLLMAGGRKAEAEKELAIFHELRAVVDEIRVLERDLLRRPDEFMTLMKLARARHMLGRNREALIPLKKALDQRPDEPALQKLYKDVSGLAGLQEAEAEPAPAQSR